MNKFGRLSILSAICLSTLSANSQNKSDFGMDFNLGAEKKICNGVNFSLDAEARTQDNTSKIERWAVGGAFGIKLYNTKKFDIKTTIGWEMIWQNRLAECKDKYDTETQFIGGTPTEVTYLSGYNCTEHYWRRRHRGSIGLAASYKPSKRWSFSLKETYQYNHYCKASTSTDRYRLEDDEDPTSAIIYQDTNHKNVRAKDRSILRSKLTAQYNIKHSILEPYASVDYGCGLNYSTSKWKFTAGTDIKINKQSAIDIFYRYQTENDDDEPDGNLLGFGYKIKLK